MKIALLGTRGIPASYSGFETCVEQLGARLVQRGYQVSVYCRSHHITYPDDNYRGMRGLIKLPTISNKYLDTIVHSFLSSLHALNEQFDIALYFIAGNSPVTWIPRLVGTKTILNVDGLDWKREKWPTLAKKYILFTEYLAKYLPNTFLTDSKVVQEYYISKYHTKPPVIPYGSEIDLRPPGKLLAEYGLESGKYILFVGRLVPENCVHHLVEAYRSLETDQRCVIVGDAPYAKKYQEMLRALAGNDPWIIFTGYQFGEAYSELGSNANIFVETSQVGGTHPAVVEAMAFGNCVVVNNTRENLETIGDAGLSYDGEIGAKDLHLVLSNLLNQKKKIEKYRQLAKKRAQTHYTWDSVTDAYEKLFYEQVGKGKVRKR